MDDFLLEFYRRFIFQRMPAEQFVQFSAYVKAGDFDGNMKDWAENLLEKDANGNYVMANKSYVRKSLPDPLEVGGEWELSDTEWEKLFKAFQKTFQQMDANKNSFKYNDKANKFLNQYFGDRGQLFSYAQATPAAETKIAELKNVLTGHAQALQQMLRQYFNDDFTWDDLITGIDSKKYNKDPKFQDRLKEIASALDYDTKYNPQSPVLAMVGHQLDFDDIANGFEGTAITPQKMQEFKGAYSNLLKELYTNSKAYEAFQANDRTKISKKLEEAKSRVDYNDKNSKSYIPPKRADELTFLQRMNDYWSDTYKNYLDKYVKFHGDRMFFSPQAQLIFTEIDKMKIKPTDGLDKIVENGEKIKNAVKGKSPAAAKHMEWFTKTMGELKNTMKKAYAGALKNGRQMHAIVEELIMTAVRDGKDAEAKTALEILSLVKYGYTTSKIMDTLNKTDLTVFSDKGLSWNKNEGVKFVTTAMDKSINWAFRGIGYGITIAGNAYNLSGSKFNGRRGRMANAQNAWAQANTAGLNAAIANNNVLTPIDVQARQSHEATLANLNALGINEATLPQRQQDLDAAKQLEEQRKTDFETKNQLYTNANNMVGQHNALGAEIQQLNAQIQQIAQDVQNLQTALNDPQTYAGMPQPAANALAVQISQEIAHQQAQSQQLSTDVTAKQQQQQRIAANPGFQTAQQNLTQYQQDATAAETAYNAARTARENLGNNINEFNNATQSVKELNDRIDKRDKEIADWDKNHKDKFRELMAYWDFLENGRNSHTGRMYSWRPFSKKTNQDRFNKKEDLRDSQGRVIIDPATGRPKQDMHKNILFQQYLNNYVMV